MRAVGARVSPGGEDPNFLLLPLPAFQVVQSILEGAALFRFLKPMLAKKVRLENELRPPPSIPKIEAWTRDGQGRREM